jgi:ATP adenylyltransferase
MEYIKTTVNEKSDGQCIFCKMLAQDADDRNYILHRFPSCFLVMNLYPYTSGHLMVVPSRHTSDFQSISPEEHSEMGRVIALAQEILKECFSPHGFNIGMNLGRSAGAGVLDHLHYHVVPRWSGDANFMSSISETRVLSEGLSDSWSRLKTALESRLLEKSKVT